MPKPFRSSTSWQAIHRSALFAPCFRSCSNAHLHKGLVFDALLINSVEDEGVIDTILNHLGLWEVKIRLPPK